MKPKTTTLTRIEKLFKQYTSTCDQALLELKLKVGDVIKTALRKKEYKTIMSASAKIAAFVTERTGRVYGQGWFSQAYLASERLTLEQRELLLARKIHVSEVNLICAKEPEDIEAVMKAIKMGTFKSLRVKRRVPVASAGLDEDGASECHTDYRIIIDRPVQLEAVVSALAAVYQDAIKNGHTVDDVDKAVQEAKLLAGIKSKTEVPL